MPRPGLYGSIRWADGSPVKSVRLDFYPGGLTDPVTGTGYDGPAGHYFVGQTTAGGNYDVPTACNGFPCPAMIVFLSVPWPGALLGKCEMPLVPQSPPISNASEPEIFAIAPPARIDFVAVKGYCQDLETEYIANYTNTTSRGSYSVLPLSDGSAAPSWQQVEQFIDLHKLPVGDPCVVGSWVTRSTSITVTGSNGPIRLSGGAGVTVTIRSDGRSVWDYNLSQPYSGTNNGHLVELQYAGDQTTRVYASAPHGLAERLISYSVTYYWIIDGLSQSQQRTTFAPATRYTCTKSAFTETASGSSVSLVKT